MVIIFYIIAFISTYFVDKYIMKNDGHSAIATCSVAGGAISVPYFVIELMPNLNQYMSNAVAQISVAMLVTTFATPFITNYFMKK